MKKFLLSILLFSKLILGEGFPAVFPVNTQVFTIGDTLAAALVLAAGAGNTAEIRMANSDGILTIAGAGNTGAGASIALHGGNETQGTDFSISNASADIINWDQSALELTLGLITGSQVRIHLDDKNLILDGKANTRTSFHMANNDGSLEIAGGTQGGGATIELFSGAHSTRIGDFDIFDNDDNKIIEYTRDDSGSVPVLTIGHTTTDIRFDGDKLGFFVGTPVAKQAHINDPTGDSGANNQAAIISILDALEAYSLLATS